MCAAGHGLGRDAAQAGLNEAAGSGRGVYGDRGDGSVLDQVPVLDAGAERALTDGFADGAGEGVQALPHGGITGAATASTMKLLAIADCDGATVSRC